MVIKSINSGIISLRFKYSYHVTYALISKTSSIIGHVIVILSTTKETDAMC
jgi:hypothetical protein